VVDPAPYPLAPSPRSWPIVLSLAALLGACDAADDRPASWSYLHTAVIAPACATAGCHSPAVAIAGLDLSSRTGAYNLLTGRICGVPPRPTDPPGNFVFAGSPERSKLMHLLRGDDVRGMPPDQPLPAVEIELFERWILEGAPCD
jgi:hypothetical protein